MMPYKELRAYFLRLILGLGAVHADAATAELLEGPRVFTMAVLAPLKPLPSADIQDKLVQEAGYVIGEIRTATVQPLEDELRRWNRILRSSWKELPFNFAASVKDNILATHSFMKSLFARQGEVLATLDALTTPPTALMPDDFSPKESSEDALETIHTVSIKTVSPIKALFASWEGTEPYFNKDASAMDNLGILMHVTIGLWRNEKKVMQLYHQRFREKLLNDQLDALRAEAASLRESHTSTVQASEATIVKLTATVSDLQVSHAVAVQARQDADTKARETAQASAQEVRQHTEALAALQSELDRMGREKAIWGETFRKSFAEESERAKAQISAAVAARVAAEEQLTKLKAQLVDVEDERFISTQKAAAAEALQAELSSTRGELGRASEYARGIEKRSLDVSAARDAARTRSKELSGLLSSMEAERSVLMDEIVRLKSQAAAADEALAQALRAEAEAKGALHDALRELEEYQVKNTKSEAALAALISVSSRAPTTGV